MHHPTDRIIHTTAFVKPVMEHWLEREIAQWVHPTKNRSDDPSHHERTLLPRSYISLLVNKMRCSFCCSTLNFCCHFKENPNFTTNFDSFILHSSLHSVLGFEQNINFFPIADLFFILGCHYCRCCLGGFLLLLLLSCLSEYFCISTLSDR